MDVLELLLHPVRIRIVNAFSGGQTRTTAELCARLADVSQATIYRHVALLTDAGVLQVVDARPVRGALERHYQIDRHRAQISHGEAAKMTREDHRMAFAAAMAALIADFGTYLDTAEADPISDGVGYRQIPVWLTDQERNELRDRLEQDLKAHFHNTSTPGRRHYLISPILIPVAAP